MLPPPIYGAYPKEATKAIEALFVEVDDDKSGYVDAGEAAVWYARYGFHLPPTEFAKVIKKAAVRVEQRNGL